MKVYRPINNNIVSAFDGDGKEIIVIGKGIGFKAREGTPVDPKSVQKVFYMSSPNEADRLTQLVASLPPEYIELTDEILTFANEYLHKELHEGAFFTLADHLHFAVRRYREGLDFQNVLLSEVKRFFPQEFKAGIYAIDLIEKRLNVRLPEDEAAAIALHIYNAEYDITVSDTFHATKLLDRILVKVAGETGYLIDESNYYCERFISHIKFLAQRVVKKEPLPQIDEDCKPFVRLAKSWCPRELACAEGIARELRQEYGFPLTQEETASLAIHIKRIGVSSR